MHIKMKKSNIIFGLGIVAALAATMTSCNNYDFDQEFYRNDVSLLSASNNIYSATVIDMAESEAGTANLPLVVQVAGSQPSGQSYTVTISPDDSLFNRYNKTNYDIDTSRFAHVLPAECYPDEYKRGFTVTIPAGEEKAVVNIPVTRLDLLSPDSTYFLEYAITDANTGVNEKKSHVMLQVVYKNDYASTSESVDYSYSSTTIVYGTGSSATTDRPTTSVHAFPLASNKIRMMAGNESYDDYTNALDIINGRSVVYTIGDQTPTNPNAYNVTITPYVEGNIEVEMLNPVEDYNNTFLINSIGGSASTNATYYKEFRLHYRYRLITHSTDKTTGEPVSTPGQWKEVKAIMRYSFNPRADLL